MWLADFPCLLYAAHGRLWLESRGLSAHRAGEYLPREWQTYKLTFPVCVCCHSYHCVCPEWCDDLGGWKTSLFTFQWCLCTDKAPSFHPLGFMCFLILVSWVFFSLVLPSSINMKDNLCNPEAGVCIEEPSVLWGLPDQTEHWDKRVS